MEIEKTKRGREGEREYHGESEQEAFTNRKNIIRSVMGGEGGFPVANIGTAGIVRHPTQYDTLNTFLHPHNTLLDFQKVFIIDRVKIHDNNQQNTILYNGGIISKMFRSII